MGDKISEWMLTHMGGFVQFVGNLGELGTVLFSIALLVLLLGMYVMIQMIVNGDIDLHRPRKQRKAKQRRITGKAEKKPTNNNFKYAFEYIFNYDDEEFDDEWMDADAYQATQITATWRDFI